MTGPCISRRQLIRTAGGVCVSGGLIGIYDSNLWARDTPPKDIRFHSTRPRNGEPELAKLVRSWKTPTELFYVRSHAPNPEIDPNFRLRIEGLVRRPRTLTLGQLKALPAKSTTATLTCAGNRRAEYNNDMYEGESKVSGVLWESGAIGNATWTGAWLADVLKQVEVLENAKHVWFEGLDEIPKDGRVIAFGGSIPIEKAMKAGGAGAPLLTYMMNDAPLTPDHGYPLRIVVPGYIGARSVKWLGKIVVSDRPSPNHYIATAYKLVRNTAALDWSEAGPIYRFPVNAAICTPAPHSKVNAGRIELAGYALPSGRPGSSIRAVLVSADDGKSWSKAQLTGTTHAFCWNLWKATVQVSRNTKQLLLRATDTQGGFMPARVPWNAKGYLQNSWYKLPIRVG